MHSGVSVLGGDAERSAEECGGGGAGVEVQDEKLGGAVEGGELLLVHVFVKKLLTCLTCPPFLLSGSGEGQQAGGRKPKYTEGLSLS